MRTIAGGGRQPTNPAIITPSSACVWYSCERVTPPGAGSASPSNGQEKVSGDLDLRSARAGAYFLSTTHEQDQAAYYDPLQMKELR